ncbi:MAG: class I SAM-dependent methyltransferase [Chlamydiota bacterium]
MKKKILFTAPFIVLLLFSLQLYLSEPKKTIAKQYLKERIDDKDKRFISFEYILKEMKKRNCSVLVETGTARNGAGNFIGDGGSTCIFADWAADHNAKLFSVDIDESALSMARNALNRKQKKYVHFAHSDSVEFLKKFDQKIDFLYLDSYDYDLAQWEKSQRHCLNELKAAYPRLHENSIIMIDDCKLQFGGKGGLAIPYLINLGWKIVVDEYQVILVK